MPKVTLRSKLNIIMDKHDTFNNKSNSLIKAAYETELPEVRDAILTLADAYSKLNVRTSGGVKWIEPLDVWNSIPLLKSKVTQAIKDAGYDIPEWQILAEEAGWTPPSGCEVRRNTGVPHLVTL